MTSPTTIKNRVSILVNGVTRLANEVFGSDLPVHAHHQHTELDHDDHLQYMTCAAGASRPFTGVVYFETGLALRGEVEISFDDHYRTHSAYPAPGIPLSLNPTEWTAFLNTYGEASILGAMVHAHNPYTAGTGINITSNVIANTGVISLCKNGQTPLGGAWSFVEGANITITQNSGNHTITIAGQAAGGAYDDSNCFYHSGSRPGTGNWTLFDGENYHGISGLTYLRGLADDQDNVFQGIEFLSQEGTNTIEVYQRDVVGENRGGLVAKTGVENSILLESVAGDWTAALSLTNTDGNGILLSLVDGEDTTGSIAIGGDSGIDISALDAASGSLSLFGAVSIDLSDGTINGSTWTGTLQLAPLGAAGTAAWSALYTNTGSVLSIVEIFNDLYSRSGVSSIGTPGQEDPYYTGDVDIIPGVGISIGPAPGENNGMSIGNAGVVAIGTPGQEDPYYVGEVDIIPGVGISIGPAPGENNGMSIGNAGVLAIAANGGEWLVGGIEFEAGSNCIITPLDSPNNGFRFDVVLGDVRYVPSSVTTANGTPTGTVAGVVDFDDGNIYSIQEVTGSPGILSTFTFESVVSFDLVQIRARYSAGVSPHHVDVEIYNYNTASWTQLGSFTTGTTYQTIPYPIQDSTNYVNGSGDVQLRFNHDQTGITSHVLDIDYVCLVRSAGSGAVASLQSAYDEGELITIGSDGPVEILASTATSGQGKCLFLRGTHASRVEPLLDILNDSTSAGPSIYFQGNAGAANEYGHELLTSETLSLHSSFGGYDSSIFDAYCRVSQEDGEGSLIARASLVADNDSMGAGSAYLRLEAEYSATADKSLAYLAAQDVTIQATGGGELYLNTNGGGNITISPGTGYTDFDSKPCRGVETLGFGTGPYAIGTVSDGSIEWDLNNGPAQTVTLSANGTDVEMTPPAEVGWYYLEVSASGGTRTLTGFTESATSVVTWLSDLDPDAGAVSITTSQKAYITLLYLGSTLKYRGWCVVK